jgi:hypothetical protein
MGPEFISRIIKTTMVLALLIALFGSVYFDWLASVGILAGAVWSCLNLYFIKGLISEVITTGKPRKWIAVLLAVVKFPVLYGAGFLLLDLGYFSPAALLAGFSLIFLVALLKVLGRLMLKMDTFELQRKQPEGNS